MLWISEKRSFKVEMFGTPVCSTFCSTKGGREPHFFAFYGKIKNPDFRWKSGFYVVLLFFAVVPPGIEPGTQGFSVLCSTNWAMAPAFMFAFDFQKRCKGNDYFLSCKSLWIFFQNFLLWGRKGRVVKPSFCRGRRVVELPFLRPVGAHPPAPLGAPFAPRYPEKNAPPATNASGGALFINQFAIIATTHLVWW